MEETAYSDMGKLVSDLTKQMVEFVHTPSDAESVSNNHAHGGGMAMPPPPKPYVFVGFAFGAVIAHEVAVEMERNNERGSHQYTPLPSLLVPVSSEGPQWPTRRTTYHKLSKAAFIEELRRRGGTEEVLAEPELLKMFLPTMRADVALEETYDFQPSRKLFSTPILALRGARNGPKPGDTLVSYEDAALWLGATGATDVSRVYTLDQYDWFMLEDERGQAQALKEIQLEIRARAPF